MVVGTLQAFFNPIKENPLSTKLPRFHLRHPFPFQEPACKFSKTLAMQPGEVASLHYLLSSNPSLYSSQFNMSQDNTSMMHLNQFSNPLSKYQYPSQVQDLNPPSFSSNSTSDEADDQQLSLINERKQRRMISNRESARRSRMRKQKHLDELWSQVVWLRNENHQLIDKLNQVSDSHDRALQENAQLKEEASELRQMLTDFQLRNPYLP